VPTDILEFKIDISVFGGVSGVGFSVSGTSAALTDRTSKTERNKNIQIKIFASV
jgi:hypothetical protein